MSEKSLGVVRCLSCESPTEVIDTRGAPDNMVRRRRECSGCKKRFTTYEEIYEKGQAERRARHARELVRELVNLFRVDKL